MSVDEGHVQRGWSGQRATRLHADGKKCVSAKAGLRAEAPRRSEWREGGSNSVVESQPSKLLVAGSIPVSRSSLRSLRELRLASQPRLSQRASAGTLAKAEELLRIKE